MRSAMGSSTVAPYAKACPGELPNSLYLEQGQGDRVLHGLVANGGASRTAQRNYLGNLDAAVAVGEQVHAYLPSRRSPGLQRGGQRWQEMVLAGEPFGVEGHHGGVGALAQSPGMEPSSASFFGACAPAPAGHTIQTREAVRRRVDPSHTSGKRELPVPVSFYPE